VRGACRWLIDAGKDGQPIPRSALTRLEARIGLVDHIDTALAANDAAFFVPVLHRLERVHDLHGGAPNEKWLPESWRP